MTETITLHELQGRFTECLFDSKAGADNLPLKPELDEKDQRLNIYRNNVFHSLGSALADLYPVVVQLVGEEYFMACARAFLQTYPPHTAAMVHFGNSFPDFLQDFEPLVSYPWLADVARVELAWHESYHAEDARPLEPGSLSQLSPDRLANSHVILHPSLRLLHSSYPVYSIWQAHQGDNGPEETINLDKGEECLCIVRPEFDVIVKSLDTGALYFLEILNGGAKLAYAIETVLEKSPGFNVETALGEALREGLFLEIRGDKI